MEDFIARENVRRLRRELENGVNEPARATMLKLLVEDEDRLGVSYEQLSRLDRHISRLAQIIAKHVELTDKLTMLGSSTERAQIVLATLNDLMATYIAHRARLKAGLG